MKTIVSGDFNNHKTKNKAIISISYTFSGTTNYIGVGRFGQPVNGLHILMEHGESGFCGLQIVGHNIHILLFVPDLATSSALLMFE